MKAQITHIAHEGELTLCGKKQDFNIAWYDKVHQYNKSMGPVTWCKTCKMVFNGEQTKQKNILK